MRMILSSELCSISILRLRSRCFGSGTLGGRPLPPHRAGDAVRLPEWLQLRSLRAAEAVVVVVGEGANGHSVGDMMKRATSSAVRTRTVEEEPLVEVAACSLLMAVQLVQLGVGV